VVVGAILNLTYYLMLSKHGPQVVIAVAVRQNPRQLGLVVVATVVKLSRQDGVVQEAVVMQSRQDGVAREAVVMQSRRDGEAREVAVKQSR
jgi:hypothetical protein